MKQNFGMELHHRGSKWANALPVSCPPFLNLLSLFFKGEKKSIRALVPNHCANHDSKLGCIVMDGKCYMLQKEYCSPSLCKYFRNVVLPNDPVLEAALTGVPAKKCPICGQRFPKESRRKYCSDTCARTARKKTT